MENQSSALTLQNPCTPPIDDEPRKIPEEVYTRPGGWRLMREWSKLGVSPSLDNDFFKQPDPGGWIPCISPSSSHVAGKENISLPVTRNYIVAVVTGGLNQMRRQIGAAVVIAKILDAALVVPVLSVNHIWKDRSEFADLFDVAHFRKTLASDVAIVTTLPVGLLRMQRAVERQPKLFSDPKWFIDNLSERLRKDHAMLLRGLDSTLADDLPLDLQKLRCKVEFEALRFSAPILAIGRLLARRMWQKSGPFLSLHLRLEKDVWVRTGCLTGLSKQLDDGILQERKEKEQYLTAVKFSNMSSDEREKKGLCPLSAYNVVRILRAHGATNSTPVFWAGGDPYGGKKALRALSSTFTSIDTKFTLATKEELDPFRPHLNAMAAIDFIVALESDVFMNSHGGNMAHVLQGHRMYRGHRKTILPNKRKLMPFLLNRSVTDEELKGIVWEAHKEMLGKPQLRTDRAGRDVIGYPVPECMCQPEAARAQ